MNSDMVKPEKFGHLHLVYHFTVPSKTHYFKDFSRTNYNSRTIQGTQEMLATLVVPQMKMNKV